MLVCKRPPFCEGATLDSVNVDGKDISDSVDDTAGDDAAGDDVDKSSVDDTSDDEILSVDEDTKLLSEDSDFFSAFNTYGEVDSLKVYALKIPENIDFSDS